MKGKEPRKTYKQKYMKEFGITSEEYDKLYDVFALRARRYEKIIGEKINKAHEFYWIAHQKAKGETLSHRRQSMEKYAASSKAISKDFSETENKKYIDLHFKGFIAQNKQLQEIYYDTTLSWKEKREKIEKWFKIRDEKRKDKKEQQSEEPYEPYEENDGSTGYDAEYEL